MSNKDSKSGFRLPPSAPVKSERPDQSEPEYFTPEIDDTNEVTAPGLSVATGDEPLVVQDDPRTGEGQAPAPASLTNAMVVSPELLQSIIASAVTAALAASRSNNDIERVVNAITAGMAANAPRRQVSIGEFMARPENRRLKMTRAYFQNGFPILQEGNISNEEITLLNAITHGGRYINRIVEVVVRLNGLEEEVFINYNNKTIDQRMNVQRNWSSFKHLLQQIVDAQKLERAEQEEVNDLKAELRRRAQTRVQEEAANA